MSGSPVKKVMAVASGGGHWIQLMRIAAVLEPYRTVYISTGAGFGVDVEPSPLRVVRDASRWNKFRQLQQALQVLYWVVVERPDVVMSTGASPGFYALLFGKLLGARTIWIDSVANAEELSMGGRKVRRFADLWLTQWPHLAEDEGPEHRGSVL